MYFLGILATTFPMQDFLAGGFKCGHHLLLLPLDSLQLLLILAERLAVEFLSEAHANLRLHRFPLAHQLPHFLIRSENVVPLPTGRTGKILHHKITLADGAEAVYINRKLPPALITESSLIHPEPPPYPPGPQAPPRGTAYASHPAKPFPRQTFHSLNQ